MQARHCLSYFRETILSIFLKTLPIYKIVFLNCERHLPFALSNVGFCHPSPPYLSRCRPLWIRCLLDPLTSDLGGALAGDLKDKAWGEDIIPFLPQKYLCPSITDRNKTQTPQDVLMLILRPSGGKEVAARKWLVISLSFVVSLSPPLHHAHIFVNKPSLNYPISAYCQFLLGPELFINYRVKTA